MANKIIVNDKNVVTIRIDGAYTLNGKHFYTPYQDRFFGSFKFQDPIAARQTLKDAVKLSGLTDTVFVGDYPKWQEDQFGKTLQLNGKMKFYKNFDLTEEIPYELVKDYIYSIEVHLNKMKDGTIYIVGRRAIAIEKREAMYNDDLYADEIITDAEKSDLPW